ncbi:MAG: FecR protein [Tistrella sp.]|uniref:FecR protein n=1 Tax=Tistrella mobilis TaxID=171437 RepID=A0A3B9IFT8_9PROT|nr:FecR protein [Tistrella sp.]HAE46702.1 FecR protein [Tistrella mobilis]
MTTAPPDRETLWQEAFDLLIRRQNAPDNPVTLRLIAEWRARSPVHDGIWREALELHALTGRAVGAAGRIPQPPARRIGRRAVLAGGVALAAGVAGFALIPRLTAGMRTDVAAITMVDLPGGGRATIGPLTAVTLTAAGADLREGLACFEPAGTAPFTVTSGGLSLRSEAGPAVFDLAVEGALRVVSVERGGVRLSGPGGTAVCAAGERLVIDGSRGVVARSRLAPGQFAAWREGRLVVEGEPVAAVLARIARWYDGRIVLLDDDLGAMPISGVYTTSDPEAAARAVIRPYGGRLRRIGSWAMVIDRT